MFQDFEEKLDQYVQSLDILDSPLRSVLTYYFTLFSQPYIEKAVSGTWGDRELADCLKGRFSYILPMLEECSKRPWGSSAMDALSVVDDGFRSKAVDLINYGHFCEIAPFYWRGFYEECEEGGDVFLSFKDEAVRGFEEKDIVLTRLTGALSFSPPPVFSNYIYHVLSVSPGVAVYEHCMDWVVARHFEWFKENFDESQFLSKEAYYWSLGVSEREFVDFRSSCLAFAQFHIDVLFLIGRRIRNGVLDEDFYHAELLEWCAPCLDRNAFKDIIMKYSGISKESYNSLMRVYSYSFDDTDSVVGEGYVPPFMFSGDTCIFCPLLVMHMMSSRNILYYTLKSNSKLFDNKVSPHLEPALVDAAAELFERVKGVEVVKNHEWGRGEFDLLLYSQDENSAVHVQAKATMPPEGARMVSRLEGRIQEAISQLGKFDSLCEVEKDQVLSRALGRKVEGVKVSNSVLSWSGFGTFKLWEKMDEIAPVNVVMLDILTRREDFKLSDFCNRVHGLVDELVDASNVKCEEVKLEVGRDCISFPVINLNFLSLYKYKDKCLSGGGLINLVV
ncbi:hypothetical protein [Halomonas sp. I5-271120]|uniref:hypothetical protein n=1 Tax=Halomonas sp. I5-271120 TaxID=3061632 RepID=UPI0027155021|nr:hypothetical protein [Halomonas sp. I5-271120]